MSSLSLKTRNTSDGLLMSVLAVLELHFPQETNLNHDLKFPSRPRVRNPAQSFINKIKNKVNADVSP